MFTNLITGQPEHYNSYIEVPKEYLDYVQDLIMDCCGTYSFQTGHMYTYHDTFFMFFNSAKPSLDIIKDCLNEVDIPFHVAYHFM